VISISAGSERRPITAKISGEVYDLQWLDNGEIVFDRIADETLFHHARIWKASVPR